MIVVEEIVIGRVDELDDPGCREFKIGDGDWPFRGFVVRQGEHIFAYQNYCQHVGHPLNWQPHRFLTKDNGHIICASHGALYDIPTGECVAGPCTGKFLTEVEVWINDGKIVVKGPTSLR